MSHVRVAREAQREYIEEHTKYASTPIEVHIEENKEPRPYFQMGNGPKMYLTLREVAEFKAAGMNIRYEY